MRKIIIFFISFVLINICYSQNWYTINGNNFKNGLSSYNGPSNISTPYWVVNSTHSSALGYAVYTFGNKFATSRITLSPFAGLVELRDLTTGALIWEKTVSDTARMYVVGFTEDAVYAADYRNTYSTIYALTVDSGEVKWAHEVYMFPGNEGICFAEDGDPIIKGKRLNRLTGVPRWTNNYVIPNGPDGGYVVNNKNDTYYHWTGFFGYPITLIAIDINTGLTKYRSDTLIGDGDQENDLILGPDGTIYITRDGYAGTGALYAYEDDGTKFIRKWSLNPGVLVKSFGPNNVLYCANINYGIPYGRLMRVNGLTGTVIDSVSQDLKAGYVTVGYDSTVYVNSAETNGKYAAFSYDLQTLKWEMNTSHSNYSGFPLGKEGVFVAIGSGTEIKAYRLNINRKPVADFRSSGRDINIQNQNSINYFDQSSYNPTQWQWTFEGGMPNTSTQQNPTNISYSAPGVYQVKLVTVNSYGSDTLIRTKYVHATNTTGITVNEITKPAYKLHQNFPNPFNPVTRIMFDVIRSDNVKISVFDVTGKEVDVILNKQMQPGSYDVDWNGEKFTSGVYFYRMVTNGYIETKRMLLIK